MANVSVYRCRVYDEKRGSFEEGLAELFAPLEVISRNGKLQADLSKVLEVHSSQLDEHGFYRPAVRR